MPMATAARLRVINLIRSGVFIYSALVIRSCPAALMNLFPICINVVCRARLMKNQRPL